MGGLSSEHISLKGQGLLCREGCHRTQGQEAPESITAWHLNRILEKGHIYQKTNSGVAGISTESACIIVVFFKSLTTKSGQCERQREGKLLQFKSLLLLEMCSSHGETNCKKCYKAQNSAACRQMQRFPKSKYCESKPAKTWVDGCVC